MSDVAFLNAFCQTAFGMSVQERYRSAGESPEEGHKIRRSKHSLVKKAEIVGVVEPEKMLQEDLIVAFEYLKGAHKKCEDSV